MIYRACHGCCAKLFLSDVVELLLLIFLVGGLSETVLVSSGACFSKIVRRMVSYCLQSFVSSFSGLVFQSEFKMSFFRLSGSISLIRLT